LRRARSISERCRLGSTMPTTLSVIWSCRSKTSSSAPSYLSAHRCAPVSASISCAGDAKAVPGLAHAALQRITHAELAPDLPDIHSFAFVNEARIARDHKQPFDPRQAGDDVLDHAVGEIFLLRVAAHVLERQYRDRRLVGKRELWRELFRRGGAPEAADFGWAGTPTCQYACSERQMPPGSQIPSRRAHY
jgi:hypothetical protein